MKTESPASTVYLGSFTGGGSFNGRGVGISTHAFDPASGSLELVGEIRVRDPSWIVASVRRGTLYAAIHGAEHEGVRGGAIVELQPGADGLALVGRTIVPFPHPTHMSLTHDERYLLVASGLGGGVSVVPVTATGALAQGTHFLAYPGPVTIDVGRVVDPLPPRRPGAAFPHAVLPHASSEYVLVADLGRDAVDSYRLDLGAGRLERHLALEAHRGGGPRTLCAHPLLPVVYCVNQLDSTVSVLAYEPEAGRLEELQVVRASERPRSAIRNEPAALALHPAGLLFVSNRGHDTIAAFAISSDGRLEFASERGSLPDGERSGPGHPRHIALAPAGDLLLVANTYADAIVAFPIDVVGVALREVCSVTSTPSPTCIVFRDESAG